MTWTVEVLDGQRFWRTTTARHDETLALVIGPTTDGRWQARCGSWRSSTRDILTTEKTVEKAKAVAVGWATGV